MASRGRSSIARQGKEPVVLSVHAEGNTTSLVSPDPYFGDLAKDSAQQLGSAAASAIQSPFAHLLRGANSFALSGVSTGKEVTSSASAAAASALAAAAANAASSTH